MAVKMKRKAKPLLFILIALVVMALCVGAYWLLMSQPVDKDNNKKDEK